MNRVFISTFFAFIVLTGLAPLDAAKRKHRDNGVNGPPSKKMRCDSQLSGDSVEKITSLQKQAVDVLLKDEKLIRDKTPAEFFNMYQGFLAENRCPEAILGLIRDTFLRKMLNISSPQDLLNSLKILCTNEQFNIITSSEENLGLCIHQLLAESKKSLLTLTDEFHQTILHCAALDQEVTARIIRVISYAAGNDVQQLILMNNNYEQSALHYAGFFDHNDAVNTLLQIFGKDVEQLIMEQDILAKPLCILLH